LPNMSLRFNTPIWAPGMPGISKVGRPKECTPLPLLPGGGLLQPLLAGAPARAEVQDDAPRAGLDAGRAVLALLVVDDRQSVDDVMGPLVARNAMAVLRGKLRQEDFESAAEIRDAIQRRRDQRPVDPDEQLSDE